MKRYPVAFFLLALCGIAGLAPAFLSAVPSRAQSGVHPVQPAVGQQPGSETPETVKLLITVRDKSGRPVADLTAADFRVLVRGKAQRIISIEASTALPLQLALIIDKSGTRRFQAPRVENEPAKEFFRQVLRGDTRALVVSFNDRPYFDSDLSNLPEQLAEGIEKAWQPPTLGRSALYEAISATCKALAKEPGRRLLIVVTDGVDNASRLKMEKAIEIAVRSLTVLYFVRVNSQDRLVGPGQNDEGSRTAHYLAHDTGGEAFDVENEKDVQEAFQWIREAMAGQYVVSLALVGNLPKGKRHKLKVESLRKGVKISAPHTFYPQN